MDFVKKNLVDSKARILQIGCGQGELAAQLKNEGFQISVVDSSPEAVEKAKAKGLDAEVADLLEYPSEGTYDAVLFSGSLHSGHPLDALLKKTKALLSPSGKLLVEDFAIEQMQTETAAWFYEAYDFWTMLVGTYTPHEKGQDPLERWKKKHESNPPHHSWKEMLKAVERNFENSYPSTSPYLYRYFAESADAFQYGRLAVQKIFEWESKLIEKAMIRPLGGRLIAKKYFSYLK